MSKIDKENDKTLEESLEEVVEESVERGEVAIGSYASHLKSARTGIFEYRIWWNLTIACISMARPNTYHRIDLRDKDTLKKLEKDLEMEIDYDAIEAAILKDSFLIKPNGFRPPADRVKDSSGKPLTKKALKAQIKRDKIQKKIDVLKGKYKAIKNKKCDRAIKLNGMIDEMEKKRDRTI